MTNRPTTVLLTGCDRQHDYVAGVLAARGLVDAVVRVESPALPWRRRLARARRRFGLVGTVRRTLLRLALTASGESARRSRELDEILADTAPEMARVPVHRVRDVSSPETRAVLRELAPAVLCVYGTAIVPDETLAIATERAINLHTGISPRYRGADCAFWPLHNGEPEWLGATVHDCTSAVDGGAIYATRRARVTGSEGVGGAFARCVQAGADLLADSLATLHSITPIAQDMSQGMEYRAAMRGWQAELRVHRNLRAGQLSRLAEQQARS